ncbi:hypothetical protein NM688_g656 [Phlebia brevispora]|uniref:Uncharacterized protein n=1 Tax=Phlebia brevispora TaxID=194682 RepID=A0ACC1TDY8_9APHY|nr:hypothetical protein NM688_g656 [Phlebia brevispora]
MSVNADVPDAVYVRNVTTIGHVDHGKTTLMDALLAANNIISSRMAGKIRYLDSREDEQERGITMESSAVSLRFKVTERTADGGSLPRTYVVNMIDTPGHVDFSSEVSTASRLCDGALVLVDVVEGVCTQSRLMLSMGGFFAGDRMEDDLRWREERERRLQEKRESLADEIDAHVNEEDEFQEKDDEDIYFAPEKGNVIFASAIDGWGFRVGKFAYLYSVKLGMKEANLRQVLWGDFYLDPKTKRVISHKHLRGRTLKPLFVQFVLENIWAVYDAVAINPNPDKVTKIVTALNLKIPPRELKSKETRQLLSVIFSQWLSLSTCVIQTVVDIVPPPSVAQATRIPKMLYPDLYEASVTPKNKLEENLYTCDASPTAGVVALVSKMFAVPVAELPENKKKPISADELRAKAKAAREVRQAAQADGTPSEIPSTPLEEALGQLKVEDAVPKEDNKDRETLLGFARIYSGTIRTGTTIACVLPKYSNAYPPTHPRNARHIVTAEIEGLYIMMGKDLVSVDSVHAGNVFAIGGLEGKVWRNATLCAPSEKGMSGTDLAQLTDSVVNLGGVHRMAAPIVRVALEPEMPADIPKLISGLKLLAQADPCVETFQQRTGEHVILTAGELHLERCLKDLRERFAKIEIHASKPIVPFRETAVKAPDMAPPKFGGGRRGTVVSSTANNLLKFAIRAAPLPKSIWVFLQDNLAILRRIQQEQKSQEEGEGSESLEGELTAAPGEDGEEEEEEVDLQGEIIKRPTVKADEFWQVFQQKCSEAGGEWTSVPDKLWAFGPHRSGTCILVDNRNDGQPPNSLRKRLGHLTSGDAHDASQIGRSFNNHLEAGFQLATFQGPLCAEPMEGLAFFVESLEVDHEGIEQEQEHNRLAQVTGSFISSVRNACRNGLLDWSPRLMLAMYECDIQASTDVLGKVYGVVARRRGRIVAEEMKEGTTSFTIRALLPVVESFGFPDDFAEIRKRTSGAASPQLVFSGYELLDQDPFWVPTTEEELEDLGEKADRSNIAKMYMDGVRERKGMFVDRKLVEFAEKQRSLKRSHINIASPPPGGLRRGCMDTALYAAQRMALAIPPSITSVNSSSSFMPQSEPVEQPQAEEEQYIPTFFCRALYDYQSNDASSLSFHKNDIIEVLTRLETGWWDGLLGDERGWFPSNYVVVISEEEAEAALSSSAYDAPPSSVPEESVVDMGEMSKALSDSDRDGDWLERDTEYSAPPSYRAESHNSVMGDMGRTHHDFWVPQVGPDGRIFYVNTQTGQRSQELPQEVEEEPDHDLIPGIKSSTLRASTSGMNGRVQEAGFGIHRRSGTPEPWVRRLADDGMSYYYFNKEDGSLSWTLPTADTTGGNMSDDSQTTLARAVTLPANGARQQPALQTRMRSDSSASLAKEHGYNATDRLSVYSDDSDVQPLQRSRAESSASVPKPANGIHRNEPTIPTIPTIPEQTATIELTPAEQVAKALQRSLSPPPSESPLELSHTVCEAIATVVEFLQTSPPRRPEHSREVNYRVLAVVTAVRNLLYVTATPLGHIPSHLYPRSQNVGAGAQALQTHLKGAHRKVAGTLSKLVLSALAMQYDPALSASDKPNRMESDAAELERSVMAFMGELQRYQSEHGTKPSDIKRLYAAFSPTNIGTGLPGAGIAGNWRGFGYTTLPSGHSPARQLLDAGVIVDLKDTVGTIQSLLDTMKSSLQRPDQSQDRVQSAACFVLAYLSSFLAFVCDINIARHVDIDVRAGSSRSPTHAQYQQTVERGRNLLRTLEVTCQALYDDASFLLSSAQSLNFARESPKDLALRAANWENITAVISANLGVVTGSLDGLLALGLEQAELEQATYNGAIEWRRSRPSIFFDSEGPDFTMYQDEEDVVDMELAFSRQAPRTLPAIDSSSTLYNSSQHQSDTEPDMSDRSRSDGIGEPVTPIWSPHEASSTGTLVAPTDAEPHDDLLDDDAALFDDEGPSNAKVPPKATKLYKILGSEAPQHYIDQVNADSQPWYLRPNYDQSEILIDPDGGVRAGSKPALIERLTAHETADPTFSKNFMITFKSFMTLDELFELLVQRFWIQPPETLNSDELEIWTKQKQVMIRLRVINTFRTMVTDEDVLEKDDMYILDRIKDFASKPEVSNSIAAAKQLVVLIDRVQRGGEGPIKTTATTSAAPPPPPILPKTTKKLKLLDVDPLELARQLTLMEASMYKKIRPIECLQRGREQKGKNTDNIASIIQLSNRIANWVAESVLSKEDSRKRAAVVKHFINVADRCRLLQNFSTMVAITSGLNTPPIRRLKRTWEQVNQRFTAQLSVCESTIDSNKNFNNYRSTLARITPPCVPFIGTYLTTLTFINDGAGDKVSGNMVNFRKRQKAAEVIQDIKRWQAKPYNLQVVAQVLAFLEESFGKYQDGTDYGDQFWHLSLEREPREREDEKMARLLQESGFL